MEEGFDQWLDRTTAPAAAAGPYRHWGREQPNSRMIDFRQAGDADCRGGTLLPMDHLLGLEWLAEAPDCPLARTDALWLRFPRWRVTIKGACLGGLRAALQAGTDDFVREYDGARWPEEPAQGEPVVGTIQVDALPPEMKLGDEEFSRTLRRGRR